MIMIHPPWLLITVSVNTGTEWFTQQVTVKKKKKQLTWSVSPKSKIFTPVTEFPKASSSRCWRCVSPLSTLASEAALESMWGNVSACLFRRFHWCEVREVCLIQNKNLRNRLGWGGVRRKGVRRGVRRRGEEGGEEEEGESASVQRAELKGNLS